MLLVVHFYHPLLLPGHPCCSHLESALVSLTNVLLYLLLGGNLVIYLSGNSMNRNAILLSMAGFLLMRCSSDFSRLINHGSLQLVGEFVQHALQNPSQCWLLGVLMEGESSHASNLCYFCFSSFLLVAGFAVFLVLFYVIHL